nr:phytanoyl-CoA dioxygenase family protein [Planctomycetota bacterium]
ARELLAAGKITDLAEDAPFDRRVARLFAQCPEIVEGMDIMHMRAPEVFEFIRNRHLLDVVESLVGPEITCNPIQHLRAKVPSTLGNGTHELVPWHQDSAVTWEEAEHSGIVTCWIPLVDATRETGCMEVLPGANQLGYIEHRSEGGTMIKPELMPDIAPLTATCPRGGVVFMTLLTPHRGLPNVSDRVRWTIDLRYQETGTPTGRPFYPDFPVRSARDADSVLTDHVEWSRRWEKALVDGKGQIWHRPKMQEAMTAGSKPSVGGY